MTKTIEVKFAEETNSERKGDSTVLSLKGRPYSEERKLLELDYSIELPLEGGRLFQEENRQLGYVIKKVSGDLEEQTKATYDSILGKLGDRHLYRCWNFVPDINSDTEEIENYKHFNAGRRKAFDQHYGQQCTGTMPAATGIDIYNNDLIILFMAGNDIPTHLENPEQNSAFNYPQEYGKIPPSFARATKTDEQYFISGTASIKGSKTVHPEDIVKQTETMLDNVQIMLAQNPGAYEKEGVVYVRKEKDIPIVREMVNQQFQDLSPVYLKANICRKNLLVEMEMTLNKKQ